MGESLGELVLVGSVSYAGAVGYGDLYRFQVSAVRTGRLEERQLTVSVLAGDRMTSDFLSGHLSPAEIEIEFRRGEANQSYRLAPVSGFVDAHNQAWEIKRLGEPEVAED